MGEMMPPDEMFVSASRSAGDLSGVFEYDGETGYFYQYDQSRKGGQRVAGAIHIFSGNPNFTASDVEVRWTDDEEKVGLFIRGELWAAFCGEERVGGNYRAGGKPDIPNSIVAAFGVTL
jgi:hypothetical protein